MAAPKMSRMIFSGTSAAFPYLPFLKGHLGLPTRLFASSSHPTDLPPEGEIPIPEWKQPENESTELKRARLLYQSRKRGMLENGLLLSTFAARYLPGLNESQLQQYDQLINKPNNDWDIFHWVTEHKPTPDEFSGEVMDLLKKHVSNVNMESRIRQPDLPEEEIRQM
ncbi:succinate dehydrogenase assembly factor 2, mitochondrial-like [Acanthaster planci]|uniref:Succinate dehydrogenase assembly factor 2, mitochondrial n=1 Tax=Acanthaster planci TaxID=133434 RepID=A0A8B7ZC78_ACAPL|nr:succinate dehydrogenase assembly factor 2, mitochondrial-like [Acanthaster planci]